MQKMYQVKGTELCRSNNILKISTIQNKIWNWLFGLKNELFSTVANGIPTTEIEETSFWKRRHFGTLPILILVLSFIYPFELLLRLRLTNNTQIRWKIKKESIHSMKSSHVVGKIHLVKNNFLMNELKKFPEIEPCF